MKLIGIALGALIASVPASAQITFQTPAPAAPAAKPADAKASRVICEREETIGSRISARKVCLTALQWEQKKEENRSDFEKTQRQATAVALPGM